MKLILMTKEDITNYIKFEDDCGVNIFLQELLSPDNKYKKAYKKINKKGEIAGL